MFDESDDDNEEIFDCYEFVKLLERMEEKNISLIKTRG